MPQLSSAFWVSQLFWLVTTFMTMLFLMSKVIVPKIADVVEGRNKRINSDLESAENYRDNAENVLKEYEESLVDARKQAENTLVSTKDEIAKLISQKESEISARLSKEIEAGQSKIVEAKKSAMSEVKEISVGVSTEMLEKIIGTKPNNDKLSQVIEKAVG